jgi:hypothetical protein
MRSFPGRREEADFIRAEQAARPSLPRSDALLRSFCCSPSQPPIFANSPTAAGGQFMNYAFRTSRMYRTKRENLGTNSLSQRRQSLVSVAREMVEHARRRTQFLPDAVFQDPQWMMALDLFIASEEGREVSVSSLCCASGVPSTTALRHIRYLQEQGIFERISHPNDKRISLVRLAEASRSQLARYLASIGSDLNNGGKHSASRQTY